MTLIVRKKQADNQPEQSTFDEPVAEIIECPVMGQQTVAEIEGRWKFLRFGDKLYTQPQAPALNPWKEAMLDGLASACIDSPTTDSPYLILDKIISANVCFATDPAINSKAAKIHIESLLLTHRHTKVGEDRGAAHDKIVDAFVDAATTKLVQKDDSVLQKRYDELIYAVGKKWPNENRHETALRYIRKAETINTDSIVYNNENIKVNKNE